MEWVPESKIKDLNRRIREVLAKFPIPYWTGACPQTNSILLFIVGTAQT
jgi:hypothetical protein